MYNTNPLSKEAVLKLKKQVMAIQGRLEVVERVAIRPAAAQHCDYKLARLAADMEFAARLLERDILELA